MIRELILRGPGRSRSVPRGEGLEVIVCNGVKAREGRGCLENGSCLWSQGKAAPRAVWAGQSGHKRP